MTGHKVGSGKSEGVTGGAKAHARGGSSLGVSPTGDFIHAEYLAVLGSQRAMLGELDALSLRQASLIDAPDVKPLLSLLDERQGVLDRIVETGRTAEPLRRQWEGVAGALPQGCCAEVRRAQDSVKQLAAQISGRDDRDQQRLRKRLESLAGELASLAGSRRATSAYGVPRLSTPRFQDQQA